MKTMNLEKVKGQCPLTFFYPEIPPESIPELNSIPQRYMKLFFYKKLGVSSENRKGYINRENPEPENFLTMDTNSLFNVLSGIQPISVEFKSTIKKELIPMTLPKGHVLLDAPKICDHAYFLKAGFAISYSFVEGKKVTNTFWKSTQFMVSYKSFINRTPSLDYIQLLERSEVFCISYQSVQSLLDRFPDADDLYRGILSRHYEFSLHRIQEMQRLSVEKRFEKLLQVFPGIEQLASQDAIASYLGITAQSLSRLKKRKGNS
jgi:CRP/FNR family transcriptional regulator, anaerobic regulatory protein